MRKWIKSLVSSVASSSAAESSAVSSSVSPAETSVTPSDVSALTSVEGLEARQLFSGALAYGINANSISSSHYGEIVNMLHETGTKTVRMFLTANSWSHSEDGIFKYIRRFHSDGIDVTLTVDPRNGLTGSYDTVKGYFDFLAGSLGGSVSRWQVGNEVDRKSPWSGHLANYVNDLLAPAADALHGHGEKVVSGSVSWNPDDIGTMTRAGMLNYVDYVGYHPYAKSVAAAQSAIAEVKSYAGGKPLIATEWNVRGHEGNKGEWANAVADYWPTIRDNFYAAYYFAAVQMNSMAGPAGVLTSGGGHNEPFYSTYKSMRNDFSDGGSVTATPTPTAPKPVTPPVVAPPVVTPPSNAPASTGKPVLAGFRLIDGVTGKTIPGFGNITASSTIKLSSLPHRQIQIQALTSSTTSSVKFGFTTKASRYENNGPFTAFVNSKGVETPWYSLAGTYTLTATGYTADNGGGVAGNTMSLVLKFV